MARDAIDERDTWTNENETLFRLTSPSVDSQVVQPEKANKILCVSKCQRICDFRQQNSATHA